MVRAGDTFLLPAPGTSGRTPHLWIVVTEPDPQTFQVVIVSVTTLRNNADQTVILRRGEHPFVRWDSSVYYGDSRIRDARKIEAMEKSGQIKAEVRCSEKVLKSIRDGLRASPFTPQKVIKFYQEVEEKSGHRPRQRDNA